VALLLEVATALSGGQGESRLQDRSKKKEFNAAWHDCTADAAPVSACGRGFFEPMCIVVVESDISSDAALEENP
jgi:hypothetical protein